MGVVIANVVPLQDYQDAYKKKLDVGEATREFHRYNEIMLAYIRCGDTTRYEIFYEAHTGKKMPPMQPTSEEKSMKAYLDDMKGKIATVSENAKVELCWVFQREAEFDAASSKLEVFHDLNLIVADDGKRFIVTGIEMEALQSAFRAAQRTPHAKVNLTRQQKRLSKQPIL